MNQLEMTRIVEDFFRETEPAERAIKVIRIPDYKTVFIEQIGEFGHSIILTEIKVDGRTYWAGYSTLSDTVFFSQAGLAS